MIKKSELKAIIENVPDDHIASCLINYLTDHVDVGEIFQHILSARDARHKKEAEELQSGLEHAFHGFGYVVQELLENKTSHISKRAAKDLTENNISTLSRIFRARNKRGTSAGDSPIGKFFFDKFLTMIRGGRDKNWESMMGLKGYIDKCLKENN